MRLPIDPAAIAEIAATGLRSPPVAARLAIARAVQARRLSLAEVAALAAHAEACEADLFAAAREIREAVYGNRMILFAPLYWSSHCLNRCLYCGFRADNRGFARETLGVEAALRDARVLVARGYRRVLLESGEDPARNGIGPLCELMRGLYALTDAVGRPCIDRVNVNIAAASVEDYVRLNEAGIGTYNLFQETYHPETYRVVHPRGPKSDYLRQITAHDRAMRAGIGDIGLGALWGLYDWRYELLALVGHARHLEEEFGVGPHTFSVPRVKPAAGVAFEPLYPVTDAELLRIIAILRLAVPYAGLVISTRESASLRRRAFQVGVTQTSAGSSTEVGGYAAGAPAGGGQFELDDRRSLDEVVRDLMKDGFIPAFCTACEQRGRTGISFARLAMSGVIGAFCKPNSLIALRQYVVDGRRLGFISEETEGLALELVRRELEKLPAPMRARVEEALGRIDGGAQARDQYI